MKKTQPQRAAHSGIRPGTWTLLIAVPAVVITVAALVGNREKLQLAAHRAADTLKQAGRSLSHTMEPQPTRLDRVMARITDAVKDAIHEVRSTMT